MLVSQEDTHQFHDPLDPASLSKLPLNPDTEAFILQLYSYGIKPAAIVRICNDRHQGSSLPSLPGSSNTPGLAGLLAQAANSQYTVSYRQVENVIKAYQRARGVDAPDTARVAALVSTQQQDVLHYQPYSPTPSKSDQSAQPFILILSTPFQRRMLDQFGRRLVFLDATGGTNKYGYMLFTLLVQDDYGRGVPVAFMVSNSEDADVIKVFLDKAAEAVRWLGPGCKTSSRQHV
jgi:hypothetical protein